MRLKSSTSKILNKSKQLARAGRQKEAVDLCNEAWKNDRHSNDALVAITAHLIDMGEDQAALGVLEDAARSLGETEAVCRMMGEVALRMNMPSIAAKVYTKACQLNAAEPEYLLHLGSSLELLNQVDEAIDLIRSSLEMFPGYAAFWNMLGMLLINYKGDYLNGPIFLNEAIRLNPNKASYYHNLAIAGYTSPEAEQHYRKALDIEPDNAQIRLSYSIYLLALNRVEEAWPHYEARLSPELGDNKACRYDHAIPDWQGENLTGKSIFVSAEQGLGDELFFLLFVPELIRLADKVFIGCDPRLVSILTRCFPEAACFSYTDRKDHRYRVRSFPELERLQKDEGTVIDYSVMLGSIPYRQSYTLEDIRSTQGRILEPDPAVKQKYVAQLQSNSKPNIAISWRSSNLSGVRMHYYLDASFVRALCGALDANFYVLQYAYSEEENTFLSDIENLHFFPDTDLKNDLEANIAIMSEMDFSIGPPTATQMLALVSGAPIVLLNNAPPWTTFGESLLQPMYQKGSAFVATGDDSGYKENGRIVDEIVAAISL